MSPIPETEITLWYGIINLILYSQQTYIKIKMKYENCKLKFFSSFCAAYFCTAMQKFSIVDIIENVHSFIYYLLIPEIGTRIISRSGTSSRSSNPRNIFTCQNCRFVNPWIKHLSVYFVVWRIKLIPLGCPLNETQNQF